MCRAPRREMTHDVLRCRITVPDCIRLLSSIYFIHIRSTLVSQRRCDHTGFIPFRKVPSPRMIGAAHSRFERDFYGETSPHRTSKGMLFMHIVPIMAVVTKEPQDFFATPLFSLINTLHQRHISTHSRPHSCPDQHTCSLRGTYNANG